MCVGRSTTIYGRAPHLQYDVRGVVQQHDQRADADVVGAVGEAEQEDGGEVVDHLLPEILGGTDTQTQH